MREAEFIIDGVSDPVARENFDRIRRYFKEGLFGRFVGRFVEIDIAYPSSLTPYAAYTFLWPHKLGFRPEDVIQTSLIGAAFLQWNYANFTKTDLSITVTNACSVRAFVGSYVEN